MLQFTFKSCLVNMRRVSVLILVAVFFVTVKCEDSVTEDSPGFEINILIQQIDRLESSEVTLYQEVKRLEQLTLTLQTEQQEDATSKNVTLLKLQQKLLELSEAAVKNEEKHQIQNEKYVLEAEQLKTNQKALGQQLEQSNQQTATLKAQLQTKNETIVQLQLQVAKLAEASIKSEEKHQFQDEDYGKLLHENAQLKLNQTTFHQQTEQQTTALQAQIENKNVALVQLQQQMSLLTTASNKKEESHQKQNEQFVKEIEQLKIKQKSLEQRLDQSTQQALTLQTQLQNKNTTLVQLQQKMSQFIEKSEKSEEKHLTLNKAHENLVQQVKLLQNNLQNLRDASTPLLSDNYKWVSWWAASGDVPNSALHVGEDWNGVNMYLARARYNGGYYVAKVSSVHSKCYVAYSGAEVELSWCEVLVVPSYGWQPYSGGPLPDKAFTCGKSASGEPMYIGRAYHQYPSGTYRLTPGTVENSTDYYKSVSVPFGGRAHRYYNFDVLVMFF